MEKNRLRRIEQIYKTLEEIVLANSGENEFEEIFKLTVQKVWNELEHTSLPFEMEDAVSQLNLISKKWPGVLSETYYRISSEQYKQCCNVICEFNYVTNDFEGIDECFEFLISREKKGAKGQFFTPRYLINFCVEIVNPKEGESILDPCSGSGGFLYHAAKHGNINGDNLWGFDIDYTAVRISRLLMFVGGISKAHLFKTNSLIIKPADLLFTDTSTTIEDFLRLEKKTDKFDVILTNPPFAGEIKEKAILSDYVVASDRNKIERDVLFIERCINLLKPRGRMAIILPDTVFGSVDNSSLRRWINTQCRIVGVVGIPRNAFMPHTPVKTSVLFLEKRSNDQIVDEPIFFGICEKVGKNSKGQIIYKNNNDHSWNNVDHDLNEIVDQFKSFSESNSIGW